MRTPVLPTSTVADTRDDSRSSTTVAPAPNCELTICAAPRGACRFGNPAPARRLLDAHRKGQGPPLVMRIGINHAAAAAGCSCGWAGTTKRRRCMRRRFPRAIPLKAESPRPSYARVFSALTRSVRLIASSAAHRRLHSALSVGAPQSCKSRLCFSNWSEHGSELQAARAGVGRRRSAGSTSGGAGHFFNSGMTRVTKHLMFRSISS
jgi:hypothetical protein